MSHLPQWPPPPPGWRPPPKPFPRWVILVAALAGLGLVLLAVQGRDRSPHVEPVSAIQREDDERQEKRKQALAEWMQRAETSKIASDRQERENVERAVREGNELRALTPAQRVETLKGTCQPGDCPLGKVNAIVNSAATPAEKATLERMKSDRRASQEAAYRTTFADTYDAALLKSHMNPDGVEAHGTTIFVRGWFCSRQFVFDFEKTMGEQARDAGFKRVECAGGGQTAWEEL